MRRLVPTVLFLAALAGLWALLSGGQAGSWLVGLPAVVAAAWAGRVLGLPGDRRLSLRGLAAFLPFFLWESVRGGVDVARRVLRPDMALAPGFVAYRVGLAGEGARRLFANTVSLLPGTLAADLDGVDLRVHALDVGSDVAAELRRVESAVARVFGEGP